MRLSYEKKVIAGLVLVLLFISLMWTSAYFGISRLIETNRSVTHTYEVLAQLESTLFSLQEAETWQRGYVITGDESYLDTYNGAVSRIQGQIDRLNELTADSPNQQRRIPLLQSSVNARLDSLKATIDTRRREGFDAARQRIQTGQGKQAMDRVRAVIGEMQSEESQSLTPRTRLSEASANSAFIGFLALTGIDLTIVVVVYSLIRQQNNRRKRAEETLKASEGRLSNILKIAEDAIISIDETEHIALFNQGAEKIFGYEAKEVLGKPLGVLLPPRFARTHSKHLSEFAASNDVARIMGERRELAGRRKDGTEFPAEASISKFEAEDGGKILTVMLRDITERKKSEEAVRESEARYRASRDASLDAFHLFKCARDKTGKVVDFTFVDLSPTAEKRLSKPKEEFVGRNLSDVLPVAVSNGTLDKYVRVFETGQVLEEEVRSALPGAEDTWLFPSGRAPARRRSCDGKRRNRAQAGRGGPA